MNVEMDRIICKFLNYLEIQEAKSLVWGYVDGGFSEDEIEDIATEILQTFDTEEIGAWQLISIATDRRLLFRLNIQGNRRYRTRMAEAIRLIARLRQLFPSRDWQTSPTLVADYRFSLRQRVYPRRHISSKQVIDHLQQDNLLTPFKQKALEVMLDSNVPYQRSLMLADFQLRATSNALRDLTSKSTKSQGAIVCAGTGTGKTLAFYLPALTHIADLVKKGEFWTKAIAIYPRNELLKDQFSETYQEARRLDAVMKSEGKRKIMIGAFFGATPRSADEDKVKERWGEARSGGFTCPYLRCPKCEGNLVWKREDIQNEVERLTCISPTCKTQISDDEIVLTRDRMIKTTPDIVFATTEILNRSMGDSKYGHIFGISAVKPPHMVLLDEVHTYTGIHGAQVSYLLKRWQHLIKRKIQFTGLSATLRNAEDFFSQLIGLPISSVKEISPSEDIQTEGMEYMIALRGDPVSGTSLLSTTIQTAMLLRRVLDPFNNAHSQGIYGSRVFAFTDDLDVTNRLFHNMLDAEARDSWNRPTANRLPLASLRTHQNADASDRLIAGQSWHLSEEIGHDLKHHLSIGRTSSQDTGVNQEADIIVATASLEVGFNDPSVGAVIQHKAPQNMASFLQRKGRAGRSRTMRPWTVVVLSDYGRDRLAYQAYDMLFDPMLDERSLPTANRYVMRIQAAYTFMEWISLKFKQVNISKGSIWNDFAEPSTWHETQTRQRKAIEIIRSILDNPELQDELEDYLAASLGVTTDIVQALMWEPPRSLMLGVLPTLLRRLESGWKRIPIHPDESDNDYFIKFSPLPDFVPANLFSDLLLPEVVITTPAQTKNSEPDVSALAIVKALKTFPVGRVTRRFGVQHAYASHWVAPPSLVDTEQCLSIEDYCVEFEEAGNFQIWQGDEVKDIRCIRPWAINPTQVPKEVNVTSNAYPIWHNQIIAPLEENKLILPQGSAWLQIIEQACYFSHNTQNPIEVRRFTTGSKANIRIKNGRTVRELETSIQFVQKGDGSPAAVGFAFSSDALVFRFKIPDGFAIDTNDQNKSKVRAFRTTYFRQRILTDTRLDGIANIFQRDWLFQIYFSMLTSKAIQNEASLAETHQNILTVGELSLEMAKVLNVIFQTLSVEEAEEGTDNEVTIPNMPEGRQPTHERLLALCNNPEILKVMSDLAQVLWQEPDLDWKQWAEKRFKATLGCVLLEACHQLCPQFDSSDLLLDIDAGARSPDSPKPLNNWDEIWITEATVGGGGVVEEIVRKYTADPANFFQLAESALEPSDFEVVDTELTRLLGLTQTDNEIKNALAQVRSAHSYATLLTESDRFRKVLTNHGILATHPVIAAINARILRPNTSEQTDLNLYNLISDWQSEEDRLGVEIDARAFAYVASAKPKYRSLLPYKTTDTNSLFNVIYGLLWVRGNAIRSRVLSFYNPFAVLPEADREILLDVLRPVENTVRLADPDWRLQIAEILSQGVSVLLIANVNALIELKQAILDLASEPIDIGFLYAYPTVEGFRRDRQCYSIRLRVREVVQ